MAKTITVPLPKNTGPIGMEWSESNLRNGNLTPAVIVGDLMVTAAVDAHTVYAFNTASGAPRWTWRATGRVTSSPTIARGLVLFGSNDGYVTALRASDGALVWRRFVAPNRRQIVVDGQVESLWPAFGSVTVLGDQAFVVAGRHNQCDGGVRIIRLDLKTGAAQAEAILTHMDTNEEAPRPGKSDWEGRSADVLTLHMSGDTLMMSNIFIDPATMAWARIPSRSAFAPKGQEAKFTKARPNRWVAVGPNWSYDDPKVLAVIGAPAAGMFDRRGSSTGTKGQNGYRFMATSPYQNGYTANLLAIDGKTMFAADRAKLFEIKMGDDGMPVSTGKGKFVSAGDEFTSTGQGIASLLTTPKQVVFARVDTNGGAKTDVLIFDRATKAKVGELSFPARIVMNGLSTAGGRLYVTFDNGEIAIIGG